MYLKRLGISTFFLFPISLLRYVDKVVIQRGKVFLDATLQQLSPQIILVC